MNTNIIAYKKQSGFSILAVILVIVAVIVAIGIWGLSGQSNINNTSSSAMDIAIEGFINDATAIKSSIEAYRIVNGTEAKLDTGTFVFDRPLVNTKLIRPGATANEGKWVINPSNFYASYIGDNSNEDITILVGGITDIMCKKINKKLQGVETIPVVTTGTSSSNVVSSFPTGFAYNYMYLANVGSLYNWANGCFNVRNIVDGNVFFFVAIPR